MSATDLVPTANMAALDTLDERAREVAITSMLDQARSWLAHAVESTAPAREIADFKAFIATAEDTARRLKVSREIQTDASVMVRRTERALGQAIRAGQERGEIAKRGEIRRAAGFNEVPVETKNFGKAGPTEFASTDELSGNGAGIYAMTDDVTDAEFETAIEVAQEEGNVSRANVVRKVREAKTGTEVRAEKWQRAEELAGLGYTSPQIARDLGMSEGGFKDGARQRGIDVRADRSVGRTRRLDTNRIIRESIGQVEAVVMGLDLINPDDIAPEEAQEWVNSLTQSIRALSKAKNTIKESIR